jgi:CRP/FNR family transcriptional regulator, anaerobic regulatory protein
MSDPQSQSKDPAVFLARRLSRSVSPCDQCTVRKQSFCDALGGQEFSRLAAIVTGRAFARHQTIVQEGDRADWLFNIISGTVKLYRTLPDGRVQIVGFLSEGDFMGMPASETYALSADALTPVEACVFPRRSFDRLLGECTALEHRLFDLARTEVASARDHMLLLGRKTARERVATFLLGELRKPDATDVFLPMSRSEIADYLGLTMETVSRTVSAFARLGLIALNGPDRVRLAQPDRLRAIAAGED